MQIPILIEPLPDGRGFRAKAGDPFSLSAEGPTRDEAIRCLRAQLNGRLRAGAEILPMELPSSNPWTDLAGFLPDDELTREWMRTLEENRRKANESADGLLPAS